MSNRVNKIKENVKANENLKLYTLYGTLVGSVIVTIGKLVNKTEEEMVSDFARFSKDDELAKCKNIKEVCDYIIKDYGMADCFKKNLVLIYDKDNKYTPIVTLVDEEDNVLPLDRNGAYVGVLSKLGDDNVVIEDIYDEEEN